MPKCKYCETKELGYGKSLDFENPDVCINYDNTLAIDYDAYSTDSSFREYAKINYCPMCGRNLKEEGQDA